MFCTNCGKKLPETAKFCTNCGTKAGNRPAPPLVPEPVVEQAPPVPEPVVEQAPPVPEPVVVQTPPAPEPVVVQTPPVPEPVVVHTPSAPEPVVVQTPPAPEPVVVQASPSPEPVVVQTPPVPEPVVVHTPSAPVLEKPRKKRNPLLIVTIIVSILLIVCVSGGAAYYFLVLRDDGVDLSNQPAWSDYEDDDRTDSTPEPESLLPDETKIPDGQDVEEPQMSEPEDLPASVQTEEPVSSPDVLPSEEPENLPDAPQEEETELPPAERDYIIPDSSTSLLTEQDLAQYSNAELVIARNEIYAKHGFIFGSKILAEWFDRKPWYAGSESFSESTLNQTERSNISLLRDYKLRRDNGEFVYEGGGAADLYYYRYFIDSGERYLEDREVEDMTKDNLEIAIEEIRAVNGIMYDNTRWREYYKSFTWYNPTIPERVWDDSVLNEYDRYNIELLRSYLAIANS